jgi:SNF family Na+-dependent transporter
MNSNSANWESQSKRSVTKLAFWTSAWVISMAVVAFGHKFLWDYDKTISIISIVVNTLIGLVMIFANKKVFDQMDELQKKIQLEALALSLAIGIVGGLSYSMLDVTNVIPWDAEISVLVVLISVTYMIGCYIGHLRYR